MGKMVRFDKPIVETPVLFNQQSVNLNKQYIDGTNSQKSSKPSFYLKLIR